MRRIFCLAVIVAMLTIPAGCAAAPIEDDGSAPISGSGGVELGAGEQTGVGAVPVEGERSGADAGTTDDAAKADDTSAVEGTDPGVAEDATPSVGAGPDAGRGMHRGMMDDEMHATMLMAAVEQGLISGEDAALFQRVHAVLDTQGTMDEEAGAELDDATKKALQRGRTDAAVAAGLLTKEDADAFTRIHDILIENGLMTE